LAIGQPWFPTIAARKQPAVLLALCIRSIASHPRSAPAANLGKAHCGRPPSPPKFAIAHPNIMAQTQFLVVRWNAIQRLVGWTRWGLLPSFCSRRPTNTRWMGFASRKLRRRFWSENPTSCCQWVPTTAGGPAREPCPERGGSVF